jgi:hypothetical protein
MGEEELLNYGNAPKSKAWWRRTSAWLMLFNVALCLWLCFDAMDLVQYSREWKHYGPSKIAGARIERNAEIAAALAIMVCVGSIVLWLIYFQLKPGKSNRTG